MSDTPQQIYTAPHGSHAICAWCKTPFTPRILNGPNADRFCKTVCKDSFWNEERRRQRETPPTAATGSVGGAVQIQHLSESSFAHRQTKIKRILAEFARGQRLHRFQAERLGDHCLHSTVSRIERYGIEVARDWITVAGHENYETRIRCYWLTEENKELARRLLGWAAWPAR